MALARVPDPKLSCAEGRAAVVGDCGVDQLASAAAAATVANGKESVVATTSVGSPKSWVCCRHGAQHGRSFPAVE